MEQEIREYNSEKPVEYEISKEYQKAVDEITRHFEKVISERE